MYKGFNITFIGSTSKFCLQSEDLKLILCPGLGLAQPRVKLGSIMCWLRASRSTNDSGSMRPHPMALRLLMRLKIDPYPFKTGTHSFILTSFTFLCGLKYRSAYRYHCCNDPSLKGSLQSLIVQTSGDPPLQPPRIATWLPTQIWALVTSVRICILYKIFLYLHKYFSQFFHSRLTNTMTHFRFSLDQHHVQI